MKKFSNLDSVHGNTQNMTTDFMLLFCRKQLGKEQKFKMHMNSYCLTDLLHVIFSIIVVV